MAFFKDFTVSLRDKWLNYYKANRDWLVVQVDLNPIKTPDGGRRPSSALILGIINALEPEAAQLMLPFSQLNPDPEKLVEVLGLNFDPDLALGSGGSNSALKSVQPVPVAAVSTAVVPVSSSALAMDDDLDMGLDAGDDLAMDDDLDMGLDAGDDLAMDDDLNMSLDDEGDFNLDDSESDELGDLDLGDLGEGELGELSSDDLDELSLDDLGEVTTGDLDDIDLSGLTDSPDEDDDLSLDLR
ncbi:MAG: DUF5331 domain-containing protein [Oscillatoriales cyanobacterium RM2_1_1]|nr:DUF5331 domain-containing protein [Oscillatoriales cyanobacterium RM2_1_1]